MLEYLKIAEDKLIDMFCTPTIIRKINSANYKGYAHDKLKKELYSGDACYAEAILESFKFKRQEKPQDAIPERVKKCLEKKKKKKKTGAGIKILTPSKL